MEDLPLEALQAYLDGTLPEAQRTAFEQQLAAQPELQEFVDAYTQAERLQDGDWPLTQNQEALSEALRKFRGEEVQDFAQQLQAAQARYQVPAAPTPLWRKPWVAVAGLAAAAALLLFLFLPGSVSPTDAYAQYNSWDELPSLSVKSTTSEAKATQLERDFRAGNYEASLHLGEELVTASEAVNPNLWLYYGISQLETGDTQGALTTFKELTQSPTLDAHKGYWYQALAYLKEGRTAEARTALEAVTADPKHYRYEEAKDLLKKLKR